MRQKLNIIGLVLPFIFLSCNTINEDVNPQQNDEFSSLLEGIPLETLNDQEKASLIFMREEEKLARDVYDFLYENWSTKIFDNISNSEQSHMDAVLLLINRYDLEDPVANDQAGKFLNGELQQLYDDLTAAGSTNTTEALSVGAAIEEIDIMDLETALGSYVDNQDIIVVYQNLAKGSRNHLRSFVKNLASQGVNYEPQYLSLEEYNAIINSDMERR